MHILVLGASGRTGRLIVAEALAQSHTVTALVRDPDSFSLPSSPSSPPTTTTTHTTGNSNLRLIKGTPHSRADMSRAFASCGNRNSGGSGDGSDNTNHRARPDAILVALATPLPPRAILSGAPATPPRFMADCVANAIAAIREEEEENRKSSHHNNNSSSNNDGNENENESRGEERRSKPVRLIIMSSLGVGSSLPSLPAPLRFVFTRTGMAGGHADHGLVDAETRQTAAATATATATATAEASPSSSLFEFVIPRPVMLAGGTAAEVRVFPDDGSGVGWFPSITRASVARFMVEAAGPGGDGYLGRSPVIAN